METNHITLSRDTIFQMLLLDKTLMEKVEAIEDAFPELVLYELTIDFIDTVMDCMGIPQDIVIDSPDINNPQEVHFSREAIKDAFTNLDATESKIKKFLSELRTVIMAYYKQNPDETIFSLSREQALAQILFEHYKWRRSINKLDKVGIKIKWADSIDPLRIVYHELGKKYISSKDSRFDEFVKTGTLQERVTYIQWIKDNA